MCYDGGGRSPYFFSPWSPCFLCGSFRRWCRQTASCHKIVRGRLAQFVLPTGACPRAGLNRRPRGYAPHARGAMKASGGFSGPGSNPKVDRGVGFGRAWPGEGANSSTNDRPNTCLPPPCPPALFLCPLFGAVLRSKSKSPFNTWDPPGPGIGSTMQINLETQLAKSKMQTKRQTSKPAFTATLADKVRRRLASPMPSPAWV